VGFFFWGLFGSGVETHSMRLYFFGFDVETHGRVSLRFGVFFWFFRFWRGDAFNAPLLFGFVVETHGCGALLLQFFCGFFGSGVETHSMRLYFFWFCC